MTNLTDEERSAILDMFNRLLEDYHDEPRLRQVMKTDEGFCPDLWLKMGELGITGLLIEPEYGGIGAGPLELELLMEQAGSFLLCSPFLASAIVAASLIGQSSEESVKQRLLPDIAAGKVIASVAMTGDRGLWTEGDVKVSATAGDSSTVLDGVASYVLHGCHADVLLVLAKFEGELALFEVSPAAAGVARKSLSVNDPTLRLSRIEFSNAMAKRVPGVGLAEVKNMMDLTCIGMAAECAGAARRIFDITIEYISERHQFGRPIGGFQAMKHMAADLLVEVESAVSVARNAAQTLTNTPEEADAAVALASFYAADAFFEVAAQAIQMHGGIAFTMEHPAHLFWRRARTNLQLFGSSDSHRESYLVALERAA